MGIELPKEVKNLVDRPNFGHLATLMPDGSPHSAPVWLGREGDFILVITEGAPSRAITRCAIRVCRFLSWTFTPLTRKRRYAGA